jgi:xanthine dehydrogenase accessory factor
VHNGLWCEARTPVTDGLLGGEMEGSEIYRRMSELAEEGTAFVVATIVESAGSTPRKTGSKMLVLADGSTEGTVGGGKIELRVTEDAVEALKRGTSRMVQYELRPEGEHALGMVCGGETKVFLEVHTPQHKLLVIGAGHIGQKLTPMAKLADFHVTVLDSRPEFADAARLPQADQVVVGHPGQTSELVSIDERTHVVIVTHGHLHDKEALRSVAETPAVYVGMIGSRRKVGLVISELREEGVSAEALARVRSPIGLDLGGHTPGEISLSILSEIIALRHGRLEAPRALTIASQAMKTEA